MHVCLHVRWSSVFFVSFYFIPFYLFYSIFEKIKCGSAAQLSHVESRKSRGGFANCNQLRSWATLSPFFLCLFFSITICVFSVMMCCPVQKWPQLLVRLDTVGCGSVLQGRRHTRTHCKNSRDILSLYVSLCSSSSAFEHFRTRCPWTEHSLLLMSICQFCPFLCKCSFFFLR